MPDQLQPLCYDCYARQYTHTTTADFDHDQWQNQHSVYRYRHSFYQSYSYRPFYIGYYHDPYYDDYDFHSFDHSDWHDHDNWETHDQGGFFDS